MCSLWGVVSGIDMTKRHCAFWMKLLMLFSASHWRWKIRARISFVTQKLHRVGSGSVTAKLVGWRQGARSSRPRSVDSQNSHRKARMGSKNS